MEEFKVVHLTNRSLGKNLFNQYRLLDVYLKEHFGKDLTGKCFAVWGLTFKPQTDDTRESPAMVLISMLLAAGAKVQAYDPAGMPEAKAKLGDTVIYASDPYQAVENADALLLMTEWSEFRLPDWEVISNKLKNQVIFDGRNIYDPNEIRRMGFEYYGIGRK